MGLPYYDWENLLPKHYPLIASGEWEGSDWVDAFYNKGAQTQSHAFNITGGNEMSRYSMGYSYMSQDGLLGAEAQSNNTRHTVRINSEHVILRVKDFDAIKFGENMNYVHRYRNGLAVGDRFSNSFSGVLTANPLLPIYNDTGENRGYYGYNDKQRDDWAFDENVGNPIGSTVLGTNGNNIRKSYNFNLSAYLQIQPIKNLILMSRYSYRYDSESRRQASFKSWFGRSPTTTESVRQDQEMGFNWMISNTLSYIFALNNHNFSVMVGQEVEKSGLGESVRADSRNNVFDLGFDYSWVDNMKATVLDEVYVGGGPRGINTLASFFGRVSYNLKETYMAEAVFRADGSSRFGPGNKWGYFPAFSAGWIISNESFMEDAKGTLDFLRVRAGWGQNGNQQIGGFQYLSRYLYTASGEYIFSDDKKTRSPGAIPGVLKNPNIKWETNENFGAGIDARFLRNRLSMSYEYYIRETKDWLLVAPISATWGFSEPYVNGGAVRNSGHELTLSWNDRAGDFNYSLNLNGSYNKNEVTRIENAEGIIRGPDHVISQTTTEIYRLQVGYPMGFWYGWVHEGIFQNWDEVGAHRDANGNLIQPTAQPGDVRFRDVNGDGMIDDGDKTFIGKAHPVYTSGFTGTLDYKGFDLIVTATGAFGHKIIKSYRSFASSNNANYTTEVFNRWTGEGTSDRWPRLTHGNNPNYQNISSLFLENANHVKIQNITIGYNFKQLFKAMPFSRFRAYVTGQNLFTFTKYPGMDPEVGYAPDGWARGVDIGLYPAAKTFLLGFDITF
jgi:TonB-linked SusC/RagA family outer membrane protein